VAASYSSTAITKRRSSRSAKLASSTPTRTRSALFHAQRYEDAAREFQALAAKTPTNDYAQFCLGRSMQLLGRHREACQPLALACSLRPAREDYRKYRDRARRDAQRS
jgi:Flp pilus assembly protein TadD